MKKTLTFFFAFSLILYNASTSHAQETDTLSAKPVKQRKNVVRYNLSNAALFSLETAIFGYERVVGKHQSISVNFGILKLPSLGLGGRILDATDSKSSGYNMSIDYRFYLPKENKNNAPRGVYLAPYFAYNYFNRNTTFTVDYDSFKGELNNDMTLKITTFGGELGYQFLLWNRVAIDLILIGPGISNYSITDKISTSFDVEEQSEFFEAINDALAEKLPGYSLVIEDGEFSKDGTVNTTTIGFRYLVHIGIAF